MLYPREPRSSYPAGGDRRTVEDAGEKKPAGTLEYWCEEDEGKGLVAPLKLDRGCWIVPVEMVALHSTCIAGHLACLQKVLERDITREEKDEGQGETQLFDAASTG